jgi:hypothetical protein
MTTKGYSAPQRWLHWLALESTAGRHLAFDLERQYAMPKLRKSFALCSSSMSDTYDPAGGAVYVCGLARSGTTIILRILDQLDVFRSLTYRDMPFVLAPNLWKRVTRYAPKSAAPTERAHGDGMLVDFDSPEAFEEVFWRTFGNQTLTKESLSEVEPSPSLLAAFADYRALVANPKTEPLPTCCAPRRYLSKNNNNLLRLRSLCADPAATVLLAYRDPVATARSLHRQHLRFCAEQAKNRFTRTYMGWLGHYEFGLDHRPFGFAFAAMDRCLLPDDPNYWLDYWNAVYSYILAQPDLRLHLVNHAALCTRPVSMLEALFRTLKIQDNLLTLAKLVADPSPAATQPYEFCRERLHRAEATYRELLASPKNILNQV